MSRWLIMSFFCWFFGFFIFKDCNSFFLAHHFLCWFRFLSYDEPDMLAIFGVGWYHAAFWGEEFSTKRLSVISHVVHSLNVYLSYNVLYLEISMVKDERSKHLGLWRREPRSCAPIRPHWRWSTDGKQTWSELRFYWYWWHSLAIQLCVTRKPPEGRAYNVDELHVAHDNVGFTVTHSVKAPLGLRVAHNTFKISHNYVQDEGIKRIEELGTILNKKPYYY